MDETRIEQYFCINGTIPGGIVAADSHLAEDLQQHMIKKSQNIRGEVQIPSDFDDFSGQDNKAVTINIEPFAIRFGSPVDQAATKLCEQLQSYIKES